MSVQSIMIEMINWRNEVGHRNLTCQAYHTEIQNYRKIANSQALKRDQHALNELLNALCHDISVKDITLAYQYKGTLYATHSAFRKAIVNGVCSTEYLHTLGLSQSEWNSLPKYNIWVNTGKKLSPVL